MRLIVSPAAVDSPTADYTNVIVELVSDDDVNMTATVRTKQGVTLEVLQGTWTANGDSWAVATEAGTALVSKQGGCGCGGSSVAPKLPAGADLSAGILP